MDIKHTQVQRLFDSVSKIAGKETAEGLFEKLPLSKTPSEKNKREWACKACAELSDMFDESTVTAIRKGCRCKPSPNAVKKLKKLFDESNDLNEFAEKASIASNAYKIEAEADALVLIYPSCYCSFAKHSTEPFPSIRCYCSLGYAEEMFFGVTGKPVRAELLESVLTGGSKCRIRVELA